MCENLVVERKFKVVLFKMWYFVLMWYCSVECVILNSVIIWNLNLEMSGGVSCRWRGEW